MSTHIQLGMAEYARRRQRLGLHGKVLLAGWTVLVAYVLLRNYQYLEAGMLKPNFRVIHQAYDFNLWELPLTLVTLAVFSLLAGKLAGRAYYWCAGILCFLALDLFALRYYMTTVEPQRLVVRHVRLESPKLSGSLRILHLSDIQSGEIGAYEAKIFKAINALKPDIILNTGDYLQAVPPATFQSEFPKFIELIETTDPLYGTYGVFGDTELEMYRVPQQELRGLKLLSSRFEQIKTYAGEISLLGLSLYESKNPEWAARTAKRWLEATPDSHFRILFGHSPDYALAMGELPIDLCLAGHTHGGQVRLPYWGALVIDSEVPEAWSSGFRRIGIPYLNVSAGAGSNRFGGLPPMRLNCPTEMTLIELAPIKSIR